MNNMAANALCSTYFADYGRSSFVPAAASVKGKLLFSTPLALPAGVLPGFVMLWNDRIVVESESMFAVFDASGRKQWERSKFINSPIAVADSLIYYQNENFFLNGVDAANKLALEDGSLPQVLDEHYPIFMLAPQKDDFVAVVQFIGGEDGSPPSARFYRAQYGDPLDMWGSSIEGGQTLQPLLAAGTNRLYIFMKRAMAVDAQTGKEVAQFDFPIDAPIIASADRNGNIYFLGSDKGKGALAAVTQDGVELWRFTDPVLRGITEAGQPPILGAGNTAFLIAGGTILAVREGNLAWKHVLPKGGFSYGAALADGSFLATAGSVVFLFDANGGQVSAIDVDEVLLTPPVVDRAGRVYVASSKTLFGLQ
jgi:outer membrane protein assembly factor BamB